MARPTKYIPEVHKNWARGLAMQGFTVKEIAQQMGIARSTINKWQAEIPEFSDALHTGKDSSDMNVEVSLYQRAVGFTVVDKKVTMMIEKDGTQKPARIEKIERHIIGDVSAQKHWLANRRPDKWREKVHFENDKHPMLNFIEDGEDSEIGK